MKTLKTKVAFSSMAAALLALAAGAWAQETAAEWFERGIRYYNAENYHAAIEAYTKAIELAPEDAGTYNNRGIAYQKKGELDLAIADYTRALQINPKSASVYSNRGIAYAKKGELDLAIADYTQALRIDPEDVGAYVNRGGCYNYKGEYDLGIADLTQVLQLDPQFGLQISFDLAKAYFDRGYEYANQEEWNLVIADWTKAIEIYPDTASTVNPGLAIAYNNRGIAYQAKGELDLAIADYTQALQIDPEKANAYYARGIAYKAKGELDLAIADYTQALQLNPELAAAYNNRGLAYAAKEELDLAIADFTQALQLNPEEATAYNTRGLVYTLKWELDLAIADFTKALQLNPEEATAYNTRGIAYQRKGELDLAIADYTKALQLNPEDVNAYTNRGIAYRAKGEFDLSLADYTKSIDAALVSANSNEIFDHVWFFAAGYFTAVQEQKEDSGDSAANVPGPEYWEKYFAIVRDGIEKAIARAEEIRSSSGARGRLAMTRLLYLYYAAVDMESWTDNSGKAFEYAESLRSRDFLDEVGREAAINLPGVKLAEREKIRALSHEIDNYQNILDSYNREHKAADEHYSQTNKKLDEAEAAIAALDKAIIARKVPRYADLRYPRPIDIEKAQAFCGEDTAVLEYVLWDNSIDYRPIAVDRALTEREKQRPAINSYCLVLTKDGVTPVVLDSSFNYKDTVKNLREGVAIGQNREVSRNTLYEKLIAPVLPYLPGAVKNIIIVPDGDLAYLPFDILRENYENPDFGETYALSLSPSVSVSMLAAKEGDLRNMAILAFADAVYNLDGKGADRGQRAFDGKIWNNLPGTAAEVKEIQRIAAEQNRPIAVYLREDVSEETIKYLSVRGELARYPILHFACHGYFDNENPAMSGIVMSEVSREHEEGDENEGRLTIPEIMSLNFSAGMALLSACETGLGETRRGQGMVGLARAFLVAGAGNVGVSLWSIDDISASRFMTALYQKVLAEGKTFREAYYEVKNTFRRGEFGKEYAKPYYWAAFTIYE